MRSKVMEKTRIFGRDETAVELDGMLPPGTVLANSNYAITEPLGQGGFGITYLARDLMLERDVVIKECYPEAFCIRHGNNLEVRSEAHVGHFQKCVEMFMREARSVARLAHPNIVEVYAVFEENKTAYMVLDLIQGADLLDVIEDPDITLDLHQVQNMTIMLLEALTVVHQQNMLHRDISPDNILIDSADRPTLIDFGSARELALTRERENTALLVVKDGYSPFEFYVSGVGHSPASDLYSLGGTIYHVIAGEAPPSSQFRQAEFQSGCGDPYQPLLGSFLDYDDAFLSAIDAALMLQPADRVQSALEWLDRIAFLQDEAPVSRPAARHTVPATLGDLISTTNNHLLDDEETARPLAQSSQTDVPVQVSRPVWVDEFNTETEDTWVKQDQNVVAAATQAEVSDPSHADDRSKSRLFQRLTRWFLRSREADHDDHSNELIVEDYHKQKRIKKTRRKGLDPAGAPYLFAVVIFVAFAAYVSMTQEGDNGAEKFMSFFQSEGSCMIGNADPNTSISFSCTRQANVQEIDVDSEEMILQMHDTDHIR